MPRAHRKAELPMKTCAVCGRPFTLRKKWARDWPGVKYCSARCRAAPRAAAGRLGPGRA